MQERYRSEYAGEFVIVHTRWEGGKKTQEKEWIPNPLTNDHTSSRAAIIGLGSSRSKFRLGALETHRGGILAKMKLQTYGVDDVYREIKPDFLVVVDQPKLEEVIDSGITRKMSVYTTTSNCIRYPGQCYMIPYNFRSTPVAVATYLAAFDEHKEIFLVGCDAPAEEPARSKYVEALLEVFRSYPSVKFRVVDDTPNVPRKWRECRNVEQWDYRKFITECDI